MSVTLVQDATFVVAILAFLFNLLFIVRFWKYDKVAVVKSLVLTFYLFHVIVFYTVLHIPSLSVTVSQQIGFTVWSQSLRFHGIFSIFLKEGFSYIMKREEMKKVRHVIGNEKWKI